MGIKWEERFFGLEYYEDSIGMYVG